MQINGAALSKINLPVFWAMAVCTFDFVLKLVFIISVAFNTGLISVAEYRDSMSLNLEVARTNDSRD